ncbi:hypothetical protein EG329_008768 [Mollisiaceae sp. DMI_Dod_QoI]|nr:hypothetical protein EG329_008768 [Helotiales sp. DMI_Dod_QoI]
MAHDVEEVLKGIGMEQYLSVLLDSGFNDWQALCAIRELDFLKLNIRLGDRRKLQREIARRQSWPDSKPLPTPAALVEYQQVISRMESIQAFSSSESFSGCYSYSEGTSTRSMSLSSSPVDSQPSDPSLIGYTNFPPSSDVRDHITILLREKVITRGANSQYNNKSPGSSGNEHASSPIRTYQLNAVNGSPRSARLNVQERLVDQACLALSSTTQGPNILGPDQLRHKLNEIENSTRPFKISSRHGVHLEIFIQNFNHLLHLFDEFSIRESFQHVVEEHVLNAEASIELILALAIGATYMGSQPLLIHLEMYIRSRVQLSMLHGWSDDLWMMRILTMIAIYHLNMFPDSACHFLDLAIQLGQENELDAASFPLPAVAEPRRSHWLRLWKSIVFLQTWLQLNGHDTKFRISETRYLINMMEPPLISEEYLNSRLTQMNLGMLSSMLKEVLRDGTRSETSSLSLISVHLNSLSRFHSELPIYFCLRPNSAGVGEPASSRLVDGAKPRQKSSILNIHVLYLGIKCQLLQSALIGLLHDPPTVNQNSTMMEYANQCVEAAKAIIDLCKDIRDSGYELKGHWIVLHFVFKAMLIMVLDAVRAQKSLRIDVWNENWGYISVAAKLIDDGANGSPVSGQRVAVVKSVLELLEHGLSD